MGINQSLPQNKNNKNLRTLQITQHDIIFKKHALPGHYRPTSQNIFYSSLTSKSFFRHSIKINSSQLERVYQNFLYGLYNSDLIIAPTYLQLGQKRQSYTIHFYTQYLKHSIREVQCFKSIQLSYQLLIQTLKGVQTFYTHMRNYQIAQKNIVFTKTGSIKVRNQNDLMLHNIDPIKINPSKQIFIVTQALKMFDKRNSKRKNQKIFQNLIYKIIEKQQLSIKSALDALIQSATSFSTLQANNQNSGFLIERKESSVFKIQNCSSPLLCRKQSKNFKQPQATQFKFRSQIENNHLRFQSNLTSRPSVRAIKNIFPKQNKKAQANQVIPFFAQKKPSQNFPVETIYCQINNSNNSSVYCNQKPSLNLISTTYSTSQHQNQQSFINFTYNNTNRSIQTRFKNLRRNNSELIQRYPKINSHTPQHQSTYQSFKQLIKLDFKKSLILNTNLGQRQLCVEKANTKQLQFLQTDALKNSQKAETLQTQNIKQQVSEIANYFKVIQQTNRQYDSQQITQHFLSQQNSNLTNFQQIKRQSTRTKTLKPNISKRIDSNPRKHKSIQFNLNCQGKVNFNPSPSQWHYKHQYQESQLSDAQTLNQSCLKKKQEHQEKQNQKTQRKINAIKQYQQCNQQTNFSNKIKKCQFRRSSISKNLKDMPINSLGGLMTIKSIKHDRSQSQVSYVIQ